MGQINPFSAYGTDPVQLDRHLIGDREGGQPGQRRKRQKPPARPEDRVELSTEAAELPAASTPTSPDNPDGPEHLDITA